MASLYQDKIKPLLAMLNTYAQNESLGLGGAAAGTFVGGGIIASTLGVALMATPVGWVLVIGAGITAGYFAAKKGDKIGQGVSGYLYDSSQSMSWTSF